MNTTESRELAIYAVNDAEIYNRSVFVIESLQKKIKSGKYDADKALVAWGYVAEAAAKKYAKEFGGVWYKVFSVADRKLASKEIAEHYESEVFGE